MFQHRPGDSEDQAAQEGYCKSQQPDPSHCPTIDQVNAPTDTRPVLRTYRELLLGLFRRPQVSDGLFVGFMWMVEQVRHEILADRW